MKKRKKNPIPTKCIEYKFSVTVRVRKGALCPKEDVGYVMSNILNNLQRWNPDMFVGFEVKSFREPLVNNQ